MFLSQCDSRQLSFFDNNMMDVTPSMLERWCVNSWPQEVHDFIFMAIDETPYSVLYSENKASRPNIPVRPASQRLP